MICMEAQFSAAKMEFIMSKQDTLKANYAYAVSNGYTASYAEYEASAYKGYCAICRRCDVKPMSRTQWAFN